MPVSGILTSLPVLDSLILTLVALALFCCWEWGLRLYAMDVLDGCPCNNFAELSGSLSSSSLCCPGTVMLVGLLMQYLGMTYLLPSSS